jgi:hypothetical protein
MAYSVDVNYYNSFLLKTALDNADAADMTKSSWPGLPWLGAGASGYPKYPYGLLGSFAATNRNWYIEESRIKGGYNNTSVDFGVRAYITEEKSEQQHRTSSLIYSGIYNPRTGVNETNVFPRGEDITRTLQPANGSIQKLFAEDTNLTIFQENKVSKALIDKDAIYSAEGRPMSTTANLVIGQVVPYLGEYGISKNPESFAVYGFRKYFADKNRSAILRLSRDGITEISQYGMRDYFRDELFEIDNDPVLNISQEYTVTNITGNSFDVTTNCCLPLGSIPQYTDGSGNWIDATLNNSSFGVQSILPATVIRIIDNGNGTCTIEFPYELNFGLELISNPLIRFKSYYKNKIVGGWDIHNSNYLLSMQKSPRYISTSNDTYQTLCFDEQALGWVSFFSYKPDFVDSLKNKFYSFIGNSVYEHYFQSRNNNERGNFYGVQNDASITFVFNPNPSVTKNFNTISYEGSNGWEVESFISSIQGVDNNIDNYQDVTTTVKSYDEGKYTDGGVIYRSGFNRKENRYVANLVNASTVRPGEIIFGSSMSGIKGYFATVKLKTDNTTDLGGGKELFAVGSNFVMSSY